MQRDSKADWAQRTDDGPRVRFLVESAGYGRLLRLGLWAISAASVGEQVEILLCAGPLRRLLEGTFDEPRPHESSDEGEAARARELGLPPPSELLAQAAAVGRVRLLTCDTELRLAGATEEQARARLDDIVSLPSWWRDGAAVRTICL